MRLGLFGGTFDPVHLGHLRVAEEVREALDLTRLVFVPAADPPHKDRPDLVGVAHRLAMLRAAIRDDDGFAVSDFEATRAEKSFSYYTIDHFRATEAPDELYFVIGADAFAEITTWHRWREVLGLAWFVVMTRPGHAVSRPGDAMPEDAAQDYRDLGDGRFALGDRAGVLFLPVTELEISSSDVRDRLRRGKSVRFLVPDEVATYIAAHGLYHSA